MALLCRLRTGASALQRLQRGSRLLARPSMVVANASRAKTDWVKSFYRNDNDDEERGPEVPDEQRGVPKPPMPAPGTPLRPRKSIRPPYAQERWQTPEEFAPRDAKQRHDELFMGMGVERAELTPNCRLDEMGQPVPKHLFPAFPKSRKLIQEYDVVVVGAGAGGMSVAHRLLGKGMDDVNRALNAEGNAHLPGNEGRFRYKTLVIEPSATHHYQPMWTLVGGGKKPLHQAKADNHEMILAMNAYTHLLPTSVVEFLPFENAVITADGRKVVYKQLVVAAGLEVKVKAVKGLEQALGRAGVSTNYVFPYPERTWDMVRFFPGGNALFTVPTGPIKCAGAPQKIMYLAEEYWRRHVGRERVNIKFMSGLPKLFGIPHYEKTLLEQCQQKGITDLNFGLNLVEVDGPAKKAVFERVLPSAAGPVGERVTQAYDFLHVTPPQGPHDFLASSQLADANGWVDVNPHTLQHNRFPNVFALGDCTNAPTSKTAAAAGAQAAVVAENLIRYREERPLAAAYDGYTACPFTLGNDLGMLAEFDYSGQPRETLPIDGATPSKWHYLLKHEVLPWVYFERLLKGNHNMDQYRSWFGKPTAQQKAAEAAAAKATA